MNEYAPDALVVCVPPGPPVRVIVTPASAMPPFVTCPEIVYVAVLAAKFDD